MIRCYQRWYTDGGLARAVFCFGLAWMETCLAHREKEKKIKGRRGDHNFELSVINF
ncbi:hypothetical protein CIPAW_13G093200 [Carya illinoinensis]|uniref:Uncharacterized protein n=1 Tax=Carya illinoinensis TaxID=32201 RepID=A0A8T1NND2_CARIL|nr:hypothetical protein CIPAW_13G093200 [Carya illinoinensis]